MADRPSVAAAPRLACLGNLTVDEAIGADGVSTEAVGGDALFAALAARVAGGRPTVLAPLGDDAPEELLDALRVAGTDPAALPQRAAPTVRNVIRYAADGSRRWHLVHGSAHFGYLSPRPAEVTAAVRSADGVLLCGMALEPQLALAGWAREHATGPVYFDPQEDYLAGNEAALRSAVARCDVFLPSEVEAVGLAGTTDLAVAAADFLALGPSVVVIKRADAGCLVATAEAPEPVEVHADPTPVVDATGAGDAFCGAFAVEHLRTGEPVAAARVAHRVAGVTVRGLGISSLVTLLNCFGGRR